MRSRSVKLLKWCVLAALALVPALAPAPAVPQAPVVIRLATFVPDGSVWHKAMKEMGAEWAQATAEIGRASCRERV